MGDRVLLFREKVDGYNVSKGRGGVLIVILSQRESHEWVKFFLLLQYHYL